METIDVTVSGKSITYISSLEIANAGEHLSSELVFTFDTPEWDSLVKQVIFYNANKLKLEPVPVVGGKVLVPSLAVIKEGFLYFTVEGSQVENEIITYVQNSGLQRMTVRPSLSSAGGADIPEYENIKILANAAITECNAARDGALAATQTVTESIEGATSIAVGLCEDQVTLASGHANDASASAILAANNILNGLNTHNTDNTSHPSLIEDIRTVEAIARGRATAYVFDTLAALNEWVAIPENAAKLVVGDNLYIRALNVKDRWWDGTQIQTLESEAPDLTNYYLKSQVDAMMPIIIGQAAYDALVAAGTVEAGRIYYVTGA